MSSTDIRVEPPASRTTKVLRRWIPPRPLWEWVAPPVVLMLILAALEWASRTGHIPRYVFPAPTAIVYALWRDVVSDTLLVNLKVTLVEILLGFGIGTLAALLLGVLIIVSRPVAVIVYPYFVALQTIPKLAIAPLLIVWFGFGVESKIAVAAMASFFPVFINTVVALQLTDRDMLDLMTSLRASQWQTLRMVKLPSALPVIASGMQVGIVLSVLGAVVGEFLGATGGLGYLLSFRNQQLDTPGVFAVLIVLGVLGYSLDALVRALRRRLAFWAELDPTQRT